jgi:hypothetical protein
LRTSDAPFFSWIERERNSAVKRGEEIEKATRGHNGAYRRRGCGGGKEASAIEGRWWRGGGGGLQGWSGAWRGRGDFGGVLRGPLNRRLLQMFGGGRAYNISGFVGVDSEFK